MILSKIKIKVILWNNSKYTYKNCILSLNNINILNKKYKETFIKIL